MPILHIHSPEASIDEDISTPDSLSRNQILAGMAFRRAALEVVEPNFCGIITPACWEDISSQERPVIMMQTTFDGESAYIVHQSVELQMPKRKDTVTELAAARQTFVPLDGDFFQIRQGVPGKLRDQTGALILYRSVAQTRLLQLAFESASSRQQFIQNICPNIATLLE